MIKIKLINAQATLNSFSYLETKKYTPNLALVIKLQIIDEELGIRLMANPTSTCKVYFQLSDGTELEKTATLLFSSAPTDLSMWTVSLTAQNTIDIIGSNFRVQLDMLADTTDVRIGMAYNVLSKVVFDGDC